MKSFLRFFAVIITCAMCFCTTATAAASTQEINGDNSATSVTFSGGDGSKDNPYQIATPDQLDMIRNNMAVSYILISDIDLSTFRSTNWLPIGSNITPFTGSLNGNGKQIKNLHIDRADTTYVGLFGYGTNCILKNIILNNVDVTGLTYTGGMIGYTASSTITNCTVNGSISTALIAGGIAGNANNCMFTNLSSQCEITNFSSSYANNTTGAGGIAGAFSGTITGCTANGIISAKENGGGLVGKLEGTLNNCSATGDVTSSSNAGGLIGYFINGEVSNSESSGSVKSGLTSGGLIGLSSGYVHDCHSNSSVTGSMSFGGFIGEVVKGKINNCYSAGSVFRNGKILATMEFGGGFVGSIGFNNPYLVGDIVIENSYTTANISGCFYAGGFLGWGGNDKTKISHCYVNATINMEKADYYDGYKPGAAGFVFRGGGRIDNCYTICNLTSEEDDTGFAFTFNGRAINCFWYNTKSTHGVGNSDVAGIKKIGMIDNNYVPLGSSIEIDTAFRQVPILITPISSDNPNVLRVNSDGTVTGSSEGSANLTVKVNVKSYEYTLTEAISVGKAYAGGAGTENNPYTISSPEQLANIENYKSAYYKLLNNINLSKVHGWQPIGNYNTPFSGMLDGSGYEISGLTLDNTMTYAGLFGYGINSRFNNLNITDAYVTVGNMSGALIGYLEDGDIANCSATGLITTTTSQVVYSGMLVGYLASGEMSNCYAIGDVTSYYAGIFAGYMGGTMENCYWYNSEAGKAVGRGVQSNLNKININIDTLDLGDIITGYVAANSGTNTSGMTLNLSTNFKLYGKPSKVQFLTSSNLAAIKISSGALCAVGLGTSVITTKFLYSNGKSVTVDYKASVIHKQYTISAIPSNSSYGSVTGTKSYTSGSMAVLTAIPKAGYYFTGWYEGTKKVSASYQYSFTVTTNRTLTAKFAVIGKPKLSSAISAGYNSIKIKWNTISGAAGYAVYRSTKSTGGYRKIKAIKTTDYTDINLKTGTKYYYKVAAFFTAGKVTTYGEYSNVQSTIPLPATPSSLKLIAGAKKITLSWKAVAGASGYEIYSSMKSNGFKLLKSITATQYANTGLIKGKKYYFKVRAYRLVTGKKIYGEFCPALACTVK